MMPGGGQGVGPGAQMGPGGIGGATPGGGAPPRAPGGPAGPGGNVPQISNERRPGLNYGSVKKAATNCEACDGMGADETGTPCPQCKGQGQLLSYPYDVDPVKNFGKVWQNPPIDTTGSIPEPEQYSENHPLTLHVEDHAGHQKFPTSMSQAWSYDFEPYTHASSAHTDVSDGASAWYTLGHDPETLRTDSKSATVTVDEESDGVRTRERRDDDTVVRLPRASKKRKYRLLDEES